MPKARTRKVERRRDGGANDKKVTEEEEEEEEIGVTEKAETRNR